MSDETEPTQPHSSGNEWIEPSASNVKLVYGLYILSFLAGVTGIIAVVFAYLNRGRATDWLTTHYTYQIRTFWIGLLFSVISMILVLVGIGVLLMFLVAVWVIVRCVKGFQTVSRNEPIANPETWMV